MAIAGNCQARVLLDTGTGPAREVASLSIPVDVSTDGSVHISGGKADLADALTAAAARLRNS